MYGEETTLIKKGCPKGAQGVPGMKNNNLLNDLDIKLGSEVVPKGIKVTSIIEVTYDIENVFRELKREVKQFYTEDGKYIGKYDPLDQFDKIVSNPSR